VQAGHQFVVEVTPQRVISRFLNASGRDDLVLNFVPYDGILFNDELAMKNFDSSCFTMSRTRVTAKAVRSHV